MHSPRAAAVELQVEGRCIASCHQCRVSCHVWGDTVQNDWMGHLGRHLYIAVIHRLDCINKKSSTTTTTTTTTTILRHILDFAEAEMMGRQWYQLDHIQAICSSLQKITMPALHHSDFYQPDALLDTQPTVQSTEGNKKVSK